jgi:hypothetical protein
MDLKPNPFSVYDFLGYLVPGYFFLVGLVYLTQRYALSFAVIGTINSQLQLNALQLVIPTVIMSYVCGHILSYLSSITIERYLNWTYGYPSKYLFGFVGESYFNLGILPRLWKDRKTDAHGAVAIYKSLAKTGYRVFLLLALFPIAAADAIFGRLLGMRFLYVKELDPMLVRLVTEKIFQYLRSEPTTLADRANNNASKVDYFRIAYHYVLEKSEAHRPKMQNYVALYGFLRTIAFSILLLLWYSLLVLFMFTANVTAFYLVSLSILSFLFYLAFIKFYTRFTLEVLMALAVILPPPGTPLTAFVSSRGHDYNSFWSGANITYMYEHAQTSDDNQES